MTLHIIGRIEEYTSYGWETIPLYFPYICRLRSRTDTFKQVYWLRIRSNPTRRNYH